MVRLSTSPSLTMPLTRHMVSQASPKQPNCAPAWLQKLISEESSGPKLYAWKSDNLGGYHGKPGLDSEVVTMTGGVADSRKRIHILGVGNLGRLYATSLSELRGPPITLVFHRKELLEQWASKPAIEISRRGVTEKYSDFDVEWWTEERPRVGLVREVCDGSSISNLIVATKAPDALPQVDRLRRYLDARSTVAFVQNGMNRLWPPNGAIYNGKRFPLNQHPNWIHCVTSHGVTSLGPFRSVHASPADIAMGAVFLNPGTHGSSGYLMEQILRAPHLSARAVPNSALWVLQLEKLVVNSTINPMTALLRCKNGLLFSKSGDSSSEKVMDLLVDEASLVLKTLALDDSSVGILAGTGCSGSTENVVLNRQALADRFSFARLRAMLRQVGEKVKDNTSSMLQDVTSGKQTEIKEFNGWFVDTAEYLGIQVTNHRIICDMVEKGLIVDQDTLGRYFPAINDM